MNRLEKLLQQKEIGNYTMSDKLKSWQVYSIDFFNAACLIPFYLELLAQKFIWYMFFQMQ